MTCSDWYMPMLASTLISMLREGAARVLQLE
jgi:hypothetical protein